MPASEPPPPRWPWIAVATAAVAVTVALVAYPRSGAPASLSQRTPAPEPLRVSHSTIATSLHSNGFYDVFGIDTSGHVIHSEMGTTTGNWGPWTAFGPGGTAVAITAAADSGRLLHVMAVMADGSVQQRSEVTLGQWGNWQPFAPARTARVLALGLDHNNQLNAFAVSPGGQLFSQKQLAPGSGDWSRWAPVVLPGPAQSVAAVQKADSYLDVVVVMANGAVEWEDEDRTGFRPWVQLGPPGTAVETSIRQNGGGGLTIYALTPSGSISNTHQESAYEPQIPTGHSWSAWVPDFQPCCEAASVDVGIDYQGGLAVLAVDTDGTLRSLSQSQADGPWTGGWKVLGSPGGFAVESLPKGA